MNSSEIEESRKRNPSNEAKRESWSLGRAPGIGKRDLPGRGDQRSGVRVSGTEARASESGVPRPGARGPKPEASGLKPQARSLKPEGQGPNSSAVSKPEARSSKPEARSPKPEAFFRLDASSLLRDCEIQTFRAGGKGGQYQNKTESAVRLIHRPTGLAVVCREERSQYQNKTRCLELLAERLRKRREKPKPRVATKVPRSEKIKRKSNKKRAGTKKLLRKKPSIDD